VTDARYCVWDDAHGDYVFTDAWIRHLIDELRDPDKFVQVIGHEPRPLLDIQTDLAPTQGGESAPVDSGLEAAASND